MHKNLNIRLIFFSKAQGNKIGKERIFTKNKFQINKHPLENLQKKNYKNPNLNWIGSKTLKGNTLYQWLFNSFLSFAKKSADKQRNAAKT